MRHACQSPPRLVWSRVSKNLHPYPGVVCAWVAAFSGRRCPAFNCPLRPREGQCCAFRSGGRRRTNSSCSMRKFLIQASRMVGRNRRDLVPAPNWHLPFARSRASCGPSAHAPAIWISNIGNNLREYCNGSSSRRRDIT